MTSAVEALLQGHTPAARHGKRSAYRPMCACCASESEVREGKPQRQSGKRPVLAWRTRLAQQPTLSDASPDALI
ncbi:hypothetical protein CHU94_12790 [Rhodoferax sp. TH121]|uniref:hypothetical protein n=1 Tax=Rhodoferax sp. TH121 TaxID=2022803 RepID=UPI000B96342C|nr:hypothetical protein [Rhodoferax sp. TH121]OYQ40185.1 hypothetical protein CHU94_12790 [Rhodoferax sp. TH121]